MDTKEIIVETSGEKEEAKVEKARTRFKEALKRAPVADFGIFAAWEAKKNGLIPEDETTDDDTEE